MVTAADAVAQLGSQPRTPSEYTDHCLQRFLGERLDWAGRSTESIEAAATPKISLRVRGRGTWWIVTSHDPPRVRAQAPRDHASLAGRLDASLRNS